jgi:hypothetical protein
MRMPVVGHIYDLLPMAVRDAYLRQHNSRVSAKIALYSKYLKYALKNVDWTIAISEHSRADLIRTLGFQEERTRVVYPAPAPGMKVPENENEIQSLREKFGLEKGYLLIWADLITEKIWRCSWRPIGGPGIAGCFCPWFWLAVWTVRTGK